MKIVREKLKEETGYSMVEVLAAIIILSLAILPMVSMFDAGLRAAVLGGNYDKARMMANSELESAKALGYPAIESVNDCPDQGEFTCTLDKTPVDAELSELGSETAPGKAGYKLEVTVKWEGSDYTATGVVIRGSI